MTSSPRVGRRVRRGVLVLVVVAMATVSGAAVFGSAHAPSAAPRPAGGSAGWTALTPASSPPGLAAGASMAYDPVDGYLVLFGGCASGDFWFSVCTPSNATWVYQNNTWSQLPTNVTPPARFYSSLVWDDSTTSLILFGGNGSVATGFLSDTWSFVHGTWSQLTPSASPPARAAAGMASDNRDGYILLVDGEQFRHQTNPATQTYVGADFNDSWKFASGTWSQLPTTNNPSARDSVSMTYDATLGAVVMFGGFNWSTYNLQETWLFQSGSWSQVGPGGPNGTWNVAPGDRNNGALAYDPWLGGDVLFGGHTGYDFYSDTWVFANGTWTLSNSSGPSVRWGMSLAYDPSVSCLIGFGGYLPFTYYSDSWSFGCSNSSGGNGSSGNGSSGNGSSGNGSSGNGSSGNGSSGNGSSGNGSSGNGSSGNGSSGNGSSGNGSGGNGSGKVVRGNGPSIHSIPGHSARGLGEPSGAAPTAASAPGSTPVYAGISPTGFLLYVVLSVGLLGFVVVVKWRPKRP